MPDPAPISLIASDGFANAVDFIPPASVGDSMQSGMTVTKALAVMEEAQAGPESVELISQSMEPKKLMDWGIESGKLAEDKLPAADVEALKTAESILANTESLSDPAVSGQAAAAAGEAASKAGFAGPGSFLAQALSLAIPAGAFAAGGGWAPAIVASTVQGAVMLSAAAANDQLPEPTDPSTLKTIEDPAELEQLQNEAARDAKDPPPAETFEKLKPFIELGKKTAAG